MKKICRVLFVIIQLNVVLMFNHIQAQEWFKGALHVHSLFSDGSNYPEVIAENYKRSGFNFVNVSDHNTFQSGDRYTAIRPGSLDKYKLFKEYLNSFGENWVSYKKFPNDSVRVRLKNLDDYRSKVELPGKFILINGEEITNPYEKIVPLHVTAFNISNVIPKQTGKSRSEILNKAIDAVSDQGKFSNIISFGIINHPNFGWGLDEADIMNTRNASFMEIFNAGTTNNYGDDEHENVEEMWDRININRIKEGRPLLYGVATDDMHSLDQANRGWVMVLARKLQADTIATAMLNGSFYSSSGVILDVLQKNGIELKLKIKKEPNVTYRIQFLGVHKNNDQISIFKEVEGTEASYLLKEEDLFVRAKIVSSKLHDNPHQKGDHQIAWTQPISH